jgi:uncharacterized protein (UPF0128 family)
MQTSSLAELKRELQTLDHPRLLELLVRLGKYKKENKELLHYLLFEAHDEEAYIKQVKLEMDQQFAEINQSNVYYVKKSVRKILRGVAKHLKYSGKAETAVQILIYFLQQFRALPIAFEKYPVLVNLYMAQVKKIRKELATLHEDIQYDYQKEIERL